MGVQNNVNQVRSLSELTIDAIRSIERNYETPFTVEEGEEEISFTNIVSRCFTPGIVSCVVAAPGTGSTAFLLRLLMAIDLEKDGAIVYSPRVKADELTLRLLAYFINKDVTQLAKGMMRGQDWAHITRALGQLSKSSFYIHSSSPQDLKQVRTAIDKFLQDKGKLRLVILDDLFSVSETLAEDGERMEAMLRELEEIAIDSNVAILFTWKVPQASVESFTAHGMSPAQAAVPENCQQFMRAIMTLVEDGNRHRLSMYDSDTGKCSAMQLMLLTGIGVMTDL